MTENTPATSTDPATGAEGDADQLPAEDTLLDRGVDDLLDEGYSPPDRPRPASAHWGETPWEESRGETLDQRYAQEEPEVWDGEQRVDAGREPDRAGRLLEDDDAVEAGGNDTFAIDSGIDGGAASAEEAAIHVIDE
jgi:hypothetical protein